MIFVYKKWEKFCRKMSENSIHSIPACEVTSDLSSYIVLKHDVETNVEHACRIAEIEHNYGHRGSYYVQANLLENSANVKLLLQMKKMGHEISYHYDVLDSNKGNIDSAIEEFEKKISLFESHGFKIVTVCQHGNPIIERNGYNSNRDFFRSQRVQDLYPGLSDIMVNFKEKVQTEYSYFSDAGRVFKFIYDPINNDITDSESKNIPYKDLDELYNALETNKGNIISMHPHRWTQSAVVFRIKTYAFKLLRLVAKLLIKIPVFYKIIGKYYYLAKKV